MESKSVAVLHINPSNLVITNEWLEGKRFDNISKVREEKENYNSHKETLSPTAAKKITKAIDYLVFTAKPKSMSLDIFRKQVKFRLTFLTLTLCSAQVHTDLEIKTQLINHFFLIAKRRWNVDNYVWKAEKQKNGNIHFHILTDKFIPHNELREVWNNVQQKLGYVDRYRKSMLEFHQKGFNFRADLQKQWSYEKQVRAYKAGKKNDFRNPNSTDIHSVQSVKEIRGYLHKYLCKETQLTGLTGRLWGCSYKLSKARGCKQYVSDGFFDEIVKIDALKGVKRHYDKYFTVYYISITDLITNHCTAITEAFDVYLQALFGLSLNQCLT